MLATTGAVHSWCQSCRQERLRVSAVVRIEMSRHFGVPAERAYAFITDMRNWSRFFPGFVSLDPESRFTAPGDVASLTSKLLGRERHVQLTFERMEPNRSFAYTSRQEGLPDAYHERTFMADGDGFTFNLSVTYEARPGLQGLVDRVVLPSAVRRLLRRTLDALEVALEPDDAGVRPR
jgi:carbon monoxide dehydrogenase subunit G